MSQRIIPFRDLDEERVLFGSLDRNLHLLRRLYNVEAVSRGGVLKLSGEPDRLDAAGSAVEQALARIRSGRPLEDGELERLMRRGGERAPRTTDETGRPRLAVEARSENQTKYLDAIHRNTVTFGIGPAGSGKSFLAMAAGVAYLKAGVHRKLVLSRPAVEAGENLGFLPGDLAAKIDPYLRPLYDAMNSLMAKQQVERYVEEGVVEILPLAYMRGRTLDDAFIVLDEAQNCTHAQMKMALTRIGRNSKMVVTGDVTQTDLPSSRPSGLVTARNILNGVEGISFVHTSRLDIVRHPVVASIVHAYSKDEEEKRQQARGRLGGGPRRGSDAE